MAVSLAFRSSNSARFDYIRRARNERAVRVFRRFLPPPPPSLFVYSICLISGTARKRRRGAKPAKISRFERERERGTETGGGRKKFELAVLVNRGKSLVFDPPPHCGCRQLQRAHSLTMLTHGLQRQRRGRLNFMHWERRSIAAVARGCPPTPIKPVTVCFRAHPERLNRSFTPSGRARAKFAK